MGVLLSAVLVFQVYPDSDTVGALALLGQVVLTLPAVCFFGAFFGAVLGAIEGLILAPSLAAILRRVDADQSSRTTA